MPALSPREATEELTRSVERMNPDDLLDFHNEVFPHERKSELNPVESGDADRRKILDYIAQGLESATRTPITLSTPIGNGVWRPGK